MERPIRPSGAKTGRPAARNSSGRPRPQDGEKRILSEAEAARQAARKEAAREERRRKKRRKRIINTVLLSILAFLLIVAASFTGLLLYLQSQTGEYDDIAQCVQAAPMEYASRFSFSAVDNTILMKLEKNDIWWLLYQTGAISALEKLDATLAANDMRLTGMGISTKGSSLAVDVNIAVIGNVRLPMTAYCTVDTSGEDIVFSVSDLKLGNGWAGPLKWLCRRCGVDPSALKLSISKSIHPMLSDIRAIQIIDDHLVLVCGTEGYIYAEALENMAEIEQLSMLGIENDALQVVLEHGASTATLDHVFTDFQLLPESYVSFRSDALALASSDAIANYFNSESAVYVQRFMPALTYESAATTHQELFGAVSGRNQLLEALATSLNTAYVRGNVTEPQPPQPETTGEEDEEDAAPAPVLPQEPAAEFVNHAITGSPELTMEQIAGNSWSEYSGWITENDLRAVYLAGFPNTTVERPIPPEEQAGSDDEDAAPQPATVTTPAKPIGLLVRLGDGSFRLYYHLASLDGNQVSYSLTSMDIDPAAGTQYLSAPTIPSIPYTGQADNYIQLPDAPPEEPSETAEQTA